MLDIRAVRQDPAGVRAALARRGTPATLEALDALLDADQAHRALLSEVEGLRAERNSLSARVAQLKRAGAPAAEAQAVVLRTRSLGERLRSLEADLGPAEERLRALLVTLPNCPAADVPDGPDASANVEVQRWGEPRHGDFEPRPHWEVGVGLGLLDFERAAKISGARFSVFTGRGAALVRALVSLMVEVHVERHGCQEVLPPFLINTASMLGTGQLPKFAADAFHVEATDLWLAPTGEVPVTNLYRDEILDGARLPLRHVAYTPCWRSEAGAAGRDTRGLIRQHQFDKVEIVHFTPPDRSPAHLQEIIAAATDVLQALELPYRIVQLCAGDMGFAAARTYDLEVWLPSYGRYVEISSCSDFGDFQARRANIRFRGRPQAPPEFVHTLNGSALAVGRTVAALLENRQRADGSLDLPEVLGPYLRGPLHWK